jgi:hypothetical protein
MVHRRQDYGFKVLQQKRLESYQCSLWRMTDYLCILCNCRSLWISTKGLISWRFDMGECEQCGCGLHISGSFWHHVVNLKWLARKLWKICSCPLKIDMLIRLLLLPLSDMLFSSWLYTKLGQVEVFDRMVSGKNVFCYLFKIGGLRVWSLQCGWCCGKEWDDHCHLPTLRQLR